jgi:ribosomal protein S14
MAFQARIFRNMSNRRKVNLKDERKYKLQALFFSTRKEKIKRITNICILTGRGKSVYRLSGLSRHMLKRYAQQGKIVGFRSSSW